MRRGFTLLLHPAKKDICNLPPSEQPRIMVVVDVEEDFDWSRGFSRHNTAIHSLSCIGRVQTVFDEYSITPVYVVDYPVASHPQGHRELKRIHDSGRCVIGAHLHPWVNPPFSEQVNAYNSFPGNLPGRLEAEKLEILSNCIARYFGVRPTAYKAGRYGVGPGTTAILEDLGYEFDLSVCPHMNYSAEGGPDFTAFQSWPYWFGKGRRLLELPLTIGFAGFLRKHGSFLHALANRPLAYRAHLPGVLARIGLVDKIWLSPEGFRPSEHRKLLRALYRDGLRVFSFVFHSPSVDPGHTPYVRSDDDLALFLKSCRSFFDFFMGAMNGRSATPAELKQQLAQPPHGLPAFPSAAAATELSRK